MRSFYPLLRLQGESPPGSSACIERICREAGGGSLHACFSGQLPLFIRWYSTPAVRPNNAFKPNALRYTNNMAGRACHVVASATHVGLRSEERRVGKECVIRVDLGGRRIIKKKKK